MVDNFEYLANLFDGLVDKDDFYFVQIIQRKKDGKDGEVKSISKNTEK